MKISKRTRVSERVSGQANDISFFEILSFRAVDFLAYLDFDFLL